MKAHARELKGMSVTDRNREASASKGVAVAGSVGRPIATSAVVVERGGAAVEDERGRRRERHAGVCPANWGDGRLERRAGGLNVKAAVEVWGGIRRRGGPARRQQG
jgi:hypothetical protein